MAKTFEEDKNICNMENILTIEFHKSEKTGLIYANFISNFNDGKIEDGLWTDTKSIPQKYFKQMILFLKKYMIIEEED